MRWPRKPVPPNTVTVRPFVATMTQMLVVEEPIQTIEQPINLAGESAQPSGPTTGRGEVTLIGSNFEHGLEWRTARSGNANARTISRMKAHSTGGRGTTVFPSWNGCQCPFWRAHDLKWPLQTSRAKMQTVWA